jgi:putative ubiquitin-RnfH superfamily antitoxin RatB of RatAB toxin-antitoxin module
MIEAAPQSAEQIHVSVVYARADQQALVELTLPVPASVQQALDRSRLLQKFPELLQRPLACAIFSRVVDLSATLTEGDRVEILRPLLIDPKENRRRTATRAAKKSA